MSFSPTIIEGTVRGVEGEAVAEASVYFIEGPAPLPDIAGLTGDDGKFSLTAPAPGRYRVGVRAEGYSPGEAVVEVGVERRPAAVVIELEREQ